MSELDKEIHEKLFGKCWHSVIFDKHKNHHVCQKCEEIGLGLLINKPPHYSTVRADAFKVVDAMEAKGLVWTFAKENNQYWADFERGEHFVAEAETLPLAICKAAKLALESEKMTLEEIKELSDAELGKMLATVVGFDTIYKNSYASPLMYNKPFSHICKSLDAIAEVEKIVIANVADYEYGRCLAQMFFRVAGSFENYVAVVTLTARQRAEASLLALENSK